MGLFYNVRKPRKFNHQPIYFDADKEKLDEQVERVKREIGMADESTYKPSIKGAIKDQTSHLRRHCEEDEKKKESRTIKMVVVLVGLLLLFYFLYIR